MKSKFFLVFWLLIFSEYVILAQEEDKDLVNWIDFKTAQKLDSAVHKPYLIDVYTDWCGWCKVMSKNTYSNKAIADYINVNFYAVKLNAEKDDSLKFKDKMYFLKNRNNELAVQLLGGRMNYPTTAFIARNGQVFPIPGYLGPREFEPFLVYFSEDLAQYVDLQEFNIDYMFTFPQFFGDDIKKLADTLKPDTLGITKWNSFEQAQQLSKKEKRKYAIFTTVPWCNSCRVMTKMSFSNSAVSKLVNENFYLINFDAATTDTITFNNIKFKSMGVGQPNELAVQLFAGQYLFPSIFFFDEDFKFITKINGFANPKFLEVVLNYIKSNAYKKQKYEDYVKSFKSNIK